ncbi:MAG: hypothetical protein L6R35_001784 [Caloplaca aegaea]|nr:MAG: hypothetical protein L6R35_001784 [Caloplaca aegaea]
MAPSGDNAGKKWYFAYGSNMQSSVMQGRGLTILAAEMVKIPSHQLSFDVFGMPYSEPAMASICLAGSQRRPPEQASNPPVHGMAFLLSQADYVRLLVSEGAGTAYEDVELDATSSDTTLRVHTLVARYPFRADNPPRPSARYMSLLIEGAAEHSLPMEYQEYLQCLPTFIKTESTRATMGASIFQFIWLPILRRVMRRIKRAAKLENVLERRLLQRSVKTPLSPSPAVSDTLHKISHLKLSSPLLYSLVPRRNTHQYPSAMDQKATGAPYESMKADKSDSHDESTVRARRLLMEVPLIDGHNDFPYMIRGWFANKTSSPDFSINNLPFGQTDLSRLMAGQVGAQFWSAFVPCVSPTGSDDFSTRALLPSLLQTLQQIDLIRNIIAQHPKELALAEYADDIVPIFHSGRVASLIGVEGLHQIGNSASVLRMYHKLGAHPRNVPDDVLGLLASNGGIIMICFLPSLVGNNGPKSATLADVADHIVYAGRKIGYAHVGIGSDFDGMLEGPRELDDVRDFPRLVVELLRRGVLEEAVRAICGGNLIRVMREVERFATSDRAKEMDILCDDVEEVWTEKQKALIIARGAQRNARS